MGDRGIKEACDKIVYHQAWLLKKEGFKNWVSYWVVLRGRWLLMYDTGSPQTTGQLRKTIELRSGSNCSLVARRKRRFPFSLVNGPSTYNFKSETELQRYHWIVSLLCASTGKPKKALPSSVPKSMQEKAVFPTWNERHAYKFANDKVQRPKSAPVANKRREKYTERKENKIRVKTENKMLSQRQLEIADDTRRQRRKSSRDDNDVLRCNRVNRESDEFKSTRSKSMLDVRANLGFEDDEIEAEVLSRQQGRERTIIVGSKSAKNIPMVNVIDLEYINDEYDSDDATNTTICEVSLHGDEVLPNMILENRKEPDLINLTTPRQSRCTTPNSFFSPSDDLAFLAAGHTMENRRNSTGMSTKAQVLSTNREAKTGDRNMKAAPRPTSPYLGPRSVGLGKSATNDLFSAKGVHLSPRFSRHNTQSNA